MLGYCFHPALMIFYLPNVFLFAFLHLYFSQGEAKKTVY